MRRLVVKIDVDARWVECGEEVDVCVEKMG